MIRLSLIIFVIFVVNVSYKHNLFSNEFNLINDIEIFNEDSTLNAVIEIPAGTIEKWEVSRDGKRIEQEISKGKLRKIDYLSYPFNYGFIPQTILPLEEGGDGDTLDVIVIGPTSDRGSIIKVKPIGGIIVLDNGKIDTKILTLSLNDTNLSSINNINDLKKNYIGLLDIIFLWIQNYKGEILEIKRVINRQSSIDYIKKHHIKFKNKN